MRSAPMLKDASPRRWFHSSRSDPTAGQESAASVWRRFRAWGQSGTSLSRQFTLLSLVVISLITLALCLVLSASLRRDLLEREWGLTADFIRTEARQGLSAADFADPFSPQAQMHFDRFYEQTVLMPEIVRVKIYGPNMVVVWSDEPRLRGQRFDNPQLVQAFDGQTTVNIDDAEEKGENVYENEFAQLVEVYVPIVFPGSSRVAGVIETYKTPRTVYARLRRGQLTVIATALAGGLFLYVCLAWFVHRAGRRIEDQHAALEQRTRELTVTNSELREVQSQLLAAERLAAIGEVVAAVAHGIRNPLANIRAAAQVARMDTEAAAPSALVPKSLTNIMAEVDRLDSRLTELLQFIRPVSPPREPVDINRLLQDTLSMVAGRLSATRGTVTEQLAPSLPAVLGSRMLLEQVFLSLIGNAVEALPSQGGQITIRTGCATNGGGPSVFAEVRDTGVGIAAEHLPRVFEPFYTTKAQGTGLGLAIAKKFSEALGGTLTVQSRPGEGSAFRVTFPACSEV
jgi:two-component system, NtrC family, sensor histidine kinase HydH